VAPDCLFCRIAAGTIPADKVHDDDLVVAFRDIAPRAPTHILLISRRHIPSARELTEADGPMLGRMFAVAADLLDFASALPSWFAGLLGVVVVLAAIQQVAYLLRVVYPSPKRAGRSPEDPA